MSETTFHNLVYELHWLIQEGNSQQTCYDVLFRMATHAGLDEVTAQEMVEDVLFWGFSEA